MSLIISPLQQLMAKDKDAECRKLYNTIQRNAERILQLVNQLMDIRKIDKGQMSLIFKKAEIVSFTRNLLETFEQQTRIKKLDLKFHTSAPEIEMWIDPKNFDKIILNLLSNACKFTPENGQVEISLNTGEDTSLPPMHLCVDTSNSLLRTAVSVLLPLNGNTYSNDSTRYATARTTQM